MNRLNGKIIESYKRGIYYKPKVTAFGKARLNPVQVITKMYVKDGNKIIGYETEASLLQRLGLTTQIPKYRFIATNRCNKKGSKVIEDLKLVIRNPKIYVTNDNVLHLQLIDAVENKDKVKIDAENQNLILNNYIVKNNLDYGKLVALVAKHYSNDVMKRIINLAIETRL